MDHCHTQARRTTWEGTAGPWAAFVHAVCAGTHTTHPHEVDMLCTVLNELYALPLAELHALWEALPTRSPVPPEVPHRVALHQVNALAAFVLEALAAIARGEGG